MKSIGTFILIILCYFVSALDALPITSFPLENNPDHLIWQAQLYSAGSSSLQDNQHPFRGAPKKITPKSIFITPNFNATAVQCPNGFKTDDKGQCIQIININQEDLLVTRLQSILAQTTDKVGQNNVKEDYYDYDDDSSETNEPFQVNLPLSIKYNEESGSNEDEKILESFLEKPTTERFRNFTDKEPETISFVSLDKRTNFTTSNESTADSESIKYDFTNVTRQLTNSEDIPATNRPDTVVSSVDSLPNGVPLKDESTANNETLFEDDNSTGSQPQQQISTDAEIDFVNNSKTENTTDEIIDDDHSVGSLINLNDLLIDSEMNKDFLNANIDIDNSTFSSTELAGESLLSTLNLENMTNLTDSDGTEEIEITTEEMSGDGSGDKTFAPEIVEITSEKPISEIESSTEDSQSDTDDILPEQPYRDTKNKFTTHHNLPDSTDNAITATNLVSSTAHPLISNLPLGILSNSVEMVQKIVEESKKEQENSTRFRFPSAREELENHPFYISRVTKPDIVRFPESTHVRFPSTTVVSEEDEIGKRHTTSTIKPEILWLQNLYKADQGSNKKQNIHRFWSNMPLVRDPALDRQHLRHKNIPHHINITPNYSYENFRNFHNQNYRHSGSPSAAQQHQQSHRENSKSPSENFYKEVSAHDSYRVIGQRHLKYNYR